MRLMMMVRANKNTEAGVMPDEKLIAAMGEYNEEMAKAGVLLDLAGLQPSTKRRTHQISLAESQPLSTGRSPRPKSLSPGTG